MSYGSIHNICYPYQPCLDCSSCTRHRRNRTVLRPAGHKKTLRRTYASVKTDTPDSSKADDLHWPDLPSASNIPTPYQIFKQKKGIPYSKRRFYELVKLYHPDHHAHTEDSSSPNFCSNAVKLERYRLIVAANNILSDPAKRSAYDRYGAGWNGRPEISGSKSDWSQAAGTGWSGFDHNSSPAQNATWEDWEKWYQRDSRGKQEPLYFSNGGFLSLIVIAAALGGIGQATRVGEYSGAFLKQIEGVHDECSKDLRRRRRESQGFGSKDERIQTFLKTRDPISYYESIVSK
ncbi:hypothetical protein MMC06_002053 [Schaereria dolodes]|nr:hypothetical protein [Schaereria dolodes]